MTYILLAVSSTIAGWLARDFFNKRIVTLNSQSDQQVIYPDYPSQRETQTREPTVNKGLNVHTKKHDKAEKILLAITGLTEAEVDKRFNVHLAHNDKEELCLSLGYFEAQSIAIEIEGLKPERPLTFDLIQSLILAGHFLVKEVIIDALVNRIFYATVVLQGHDGEIELDTRPSDALVIALKNKAPVYTYKNVVKTYRDTGLNWS